MYNCKDLGNELLGTNYERTLSGIILRKKVLSNKG